MHKKNVEIPLSPRWSNKFVKKLNEGEDLVKCLEKIETRKFLEFATRFPGRSQKEAITATSIEQPYFTTMFFPLIKAGIVIVEDNPSDPRAVSYFIDMEVLEQKLLIIKKLGSHVPTSTRRKSNSHRGVLSEDGISLY